MGKSPDNFDSFLEDVKIICEAKGKGLNLLYEDLEIEIDE